jgi:hypothetical protein
MFRFLKVLYLLAGQQLGRSKNWDLGDWKIGIVRGFKRLWMCKRVQFIFWTQQLKGRPLECGKVIIDLISYQEKNLTIKNKIQKVLIIQEEILISPSAISIRKLTDGMTNELFRNIIPNMVWLLKISFLLWVN